MLIDHKAIRFKQWVMIVVYIKQSIKWDTDIFHLIQPIGSQSYRTKKVVDFNFYTEPRQCGLSLLIDCSISAITISSYSALDDSPFNLISRK